nr:epoxide hydrolase N-terminal domain-containing protein [Sedimentitalea sp. CY04]
MTKPTPFRTHASDTQMENLCTRLHNTQWPERETVDDWSQEAPLSYVQEVALTGPISTTGAHAKQH